MVRWIPLFQGCSRTWGTEQVQNFSFQGAWLVWAQFLAGGASVAVLMAVHGVSIRFSGYWSEYNCGLMPRRSGIFCVYRAHFDDESKITTMRELLYIGAAANVQGCLVDHPQCARWRACLEPTDSLSFSFGSVPPDDLLACETALVMQHRPRCNDAVAVVFPFDRLSLKLTHRTPLLKRRFTVGTDHAQASGGLGAGWLRRWLDLLRKNQPG
jgi:hypothetical protein